MGQAVHDCEFAFLLQVQPFWSVLLDGFTCQHPSDASTAQIWIFGRCRNARIAPEGNAQINDQYAAGGFFLFVAHLGGPRRSVHPTCSMPSSAASRSTPSVVRTILDVADVVPAGVRQVVEPGGHRRRRPDPSRVADPASLGGVGSAGRICRSGAHPAPRVITCTSCMATTCMGSMERADTSSFTIRMNIT